MRSSCGVFRAAAAQSFPRRHTQCPTRIREVLTRRSCNSWRSGEKEHLVLHRHPGSRRRRACPRGSRDRSARRRPMSALVASYTGSVWYPEQVSPTGKRQTSGWTRRPGVSRNLRSYRARSAGPRVSLRVRRQGDIMTVKRMDNVGIVVEDIDAAIEFFTELGLELEGRAPIEGDWADGVTGLRDMLVEIAMMRTPDGHSRLEMSRFLAPPVVADHRSAPVNALGYLRVMFTVENIDDTLARLGKRGAELVGEVVQYEDTYRLCYIRGTEGILIGLAQELGQQTSR